MINSLLKLSALGFALSTFAFQGAMAAYCLMTFTALFLLKTA
jgi:hypothetical protein